MALHGRCSVVARLALTLILFLSSSLSCLSMTYSSNIARRGTPSYIKDRPRLSSHALVFATRVSTSARIKPFITLAKH
ncbi:Os06g0308550 [Oryza sativa Japonica Group]|uniref:Os06g0308550 protein n=1 Tax=Oryza sativa subsp. japonica TaxID=39947 RepID=A0A0P0WVU9_ORYSJ|nr:hypothetical protein EE612_033600 [Oryza sativa]BAS97424.1 Os06g0308550 [Oryza sativa Japonica Group]